MSSERGDEREAITGAFVDWRNAVMEAMTAMADGREHKTPSLLDAMAPYRLGWSPARTARAIMAIDHGDYRMLMDMQMTAEGRPTLGGNKNG